MKSLILSSHFFPETIQPTYEANLQLMACILQLYTPTHMHSVSASNTYTHYNICLMCVWILNGEQQKGGYVETLLPIVRSCNLREGKVAWHSQANTNHQKSFSSPWNGSAIPFEKEAAGKDNAIAEKRHMFSNTDDFSTYRVYLLKMKKKGRTEW